MVIHQMHECIHNNYQLSGNLKRVSILSLFFSSKKKKKRESIVMNAQKRSNY
jgi:hypothetical protein